MNWLEVGCPHCPSKLTFPRSAAGRTVACPECERSYLVPTPAAQAPRSGAWSPEPKSRPVDKPEHRPSAGDEPTVAYEPDLPRAEDPTVANRPTPESPPKREPVQSEFRPPGPKRQLLPQKNVASADDPKLAPDSPLAELPILDPPRRSGPPPSMPAPPAKPERNNPAASAGPAPAPTASRSQLDESRDLTAEAKLRMRRAQLRTRVNLAIFAGGTLVMVIFAWLVVRFSRPQ